MESVSQGTRLDYPSSRMALRHQHPEGPLTAPARENATRDTAPARDRAKTNVETDPRFRDATRFQESLCAPVERALLKWLAARTPAAINSDHLTLLGFVAQACGGLCYALARWWAPALLFVDVFIALNWLGDSLDGTLARYRNKLRPRYGFYVDHMTDTLGALFLMCGLAVSGYAHERVAIGMLVAFLLISVQTYLATYSVGTFTLSFWRMSPTEIRILLAIGNAYACFHPRTHLAGREFMFFDIAGTIAAVSMLVVLVASTAGNTISLYRAEKL